MKKHFLNGGKGKESYIKSTKIKLPRATYHILFLGVCLVVSGVIMAIFGYYAPLLKMTHSSKLGSSRESSEHIAKSNDSNQLTPGVQSGARKSPKSHFLSLKDKYAAAVESNAERSKGKSAWLDWYELRLTVFSYAGPCFMGLGCIILVVVYVVAFEARDRARHSSVIVLKDASIQSSQRLMTTRPDSFWRETYRPLLNRNGSLHPRSPRLSANLSDPELYGRFGRNTETEQDIFDAKSNLVPTIMIGDSFSGIMSDVPSCSHVSTPSDPRYGVVLTCDDDEDKTNLLSKTNNLNLDVGETNWGTRRPHL